MAMGWLAQALETLNALLAERPDDPRLSRLRDQVAASKVQLESNVRLTQGRATEFVAFMRRLM